MARTPTDGTRDSDGSNLETQANAPATRGTGVNSEQPEPGNHAGGEGGIPSGEARSYDQHGDQMGHDYGSGGGTD